MARPKDNVEIATFKKMATKKFVELVEANVKADAIELELTLEIGGKDGSDGIVWRAYRRGGKSMSFPRLLDKIEFAVQKDILNRRQANDFLTELGVEYSRIETAQHKNEKRGYNRLTSKRVEFESSVRKVIELAHELEELSDGHASTLDLLEPVQTLIRDLLSKNGAVPPRKKNAARSIGAGLLMEVEGKWGTMVPEAGVRKLFGAAHGVPIKNGVATSKSVAARLAAARKEALASMNRF